MKKSLIALAVLAMSASITVRAKTRDAAFGFRMGAGFAGDVNRTHPASILPGLQDVTNPVRLFGDAAIINTAANSYRAFLSTDAAVTKLAGVLVRPYPTQQTSGGMSSPLGAIAANVTGVVDVVNEGFVMVRCNNFAAQQPTKGGAVFIWITASAGSHVQGGFESTVNAGNTVAISNAMFNGPGDANGICELQVMAN